MSMTLKTTKNLFFGLSVVFKITTRRSTIDVWKKSDLSRKNRTTGPPGHVRKISDQPQPAKASSTLGLLRRNLSLCPQKLREQAYISLIRSRLEYCAAIWDPHLEKDIQQLEAIQRRAARFVVQDFSRYSSVKSYLNDLKWAPLKDRRRDIRLTFLFKIVTGRVAVQAEGTLLPADSRTRHKHKHKYKHLPATCNQCLNFFFINSIPDWNSLPEACITADTVTAFQSRLRCPP